MSEERDGGGADPEQRQLERALELFDAGRYHQAHEVLDELWEATHGADADFYKGLIQAAIAMHHFARSNAEGARKLYSGHRRYLAPYLPAHRGLDLAALLAEMQRVLRPLARTAPGAPGPTFALDTRPRVRFLAKG